MIRNCQEKIVESLWIIETTMICYWHLLSELHLYILFLLVFVHSYCYSE